VLALAGVLALLATGALNRRLVAPLLCLGAVLEIATSLQRTQILGSVAVLIGFALLCLNAPRRPLRPLVALLAVVAMAFALGAVLVSVEGKGTFSRYLSITPSSTGARTTSYREKTLLQIPKDVATAPFGVGLATVGAAAGFGEAAHVEIEGQGASAESQYNFITLELGLPGLLLWIALSVKLIVLGVRRLRRIIDSELRIELAAVLATLIAFTLMGLAGPTMASVPFGPYFWFAAGILAYWFAGPGRTAQSMVRASPR
jgi:O-antigen ligase